MKGLEVLRRIEDQEPQEPKVERVDVSTRIKLCEALTSSGEYGIPWQNWGKLPGTKSIGALLKEIRAGESTFTRTINIRTKEIKLIREVSKAVIDVIFEKENGDKERLYEEFLENGIWRRREQKEKTLKRGIQEKILPGETSTIAALRGLKEEIQIADLTTDELSRLVFQHNSMEDRPSRGYPGLFTRYSFSDFTFELPERFYKPEGYLVKEAGFKTRLVWEKIQ